VTATTVVSVAEIFNYWLQAGRIDVGFLGAAQIDRFGNINTTVIGDYAAPEVRLPGAGGAAEIATSAKEVLIVMRQSSRAFVPELDFRTSAGFLGGRGERRRAGLPGRGPRAIITDVGVLTPDPESEEFVLSTLHPGRTLDEARAATGWSLRAAETIETSPPPTTEELGTLRDLHERTRRAHGERA
jgi:glutaconate CoA-transferase, subunit B